MLDVDWADGGNAAGRTFSGYAADVGILGGVVVVQCVGGNMQLGTDGSWQLMSQVLDGWIEGRRCLMRQH
jgi:hypothetical protein